MDKQDYAEATLTFSYFIFYKQYVKIVTTKFTILKRNFAQCVSYPFQELIDNVEVSILSYYTKLAILWLSKLTVAT